MILDGGSQRIYIMVQLREQLALPTLQNRNTDDLVIWWKDYVIQVGVKTRHGNIFATLQLLVVPLICEPLTRQLVTCARER